MTRAPRWSLILVLLLAALGGRARAEELSSDAPAAAFRKDVTRYLPTTSSAATATSVDVTSAFGGYDGAARAPVFGVTTELRLNRRVSLVGGVAYTSLAAADAGVRPQLGARVQVLEQAASGVDASASFLFRQDRFTAEDGLFQGSIAVGRSFGDTSAVVNVVYGQDGEGDDHEGELRLAGLHRLGDAVHVGVEGRTMHALASTDPHRAANATPSMEAMAGPVVAVTAGRWAVVAEAGVSTRKTTGWQTGLVTVAGIGTSF